LLDSTKRLFSHSGKADEGPRNRSRREMERGSFDAREVSSGSAGAVPDPVCDVPKAWATLYYDGSCPLCTAEMEHYRSRKGGGRLRFADVSQKATELGPGLAADAAMRRFHVRLADGTLLSGARAFVAIWQVLPGWRWIARFARFPGVTPILEVAYRSFLPIRPALSILAARLGAKPANRGEPRL